MAIIHCGALKITITLIRIDECGEEKVVKDYTSYDTRKLELVVRSLLREPKPGLFNSTEVDLYQEVQWLKDGSHKLKIEIEPDRFPWEERHLHGIR